LIAAPVKVAKYGTPLSDSGLRNSSPPPQFTREFKAIIASGINSLGILRPPDVDGGLAAAATNRDPNCFTFSLAHSGPPCWASTQSDDTHA
jgi:hypothetical protein